MGRQNTFMATRIAADDIHTAAENQEGGGVPLTEFVEKLVRGVRARGTRGEFPRNFHLRRREDGEDLVAALI